MATAPPPVQADLLPVAPMTLGKVEDVLLDRLPPDDALLGDPPTADLLNSLRRWGVLEPLLVRTVGGQLDYGDFQHLIAGRRRLKAARVLRQEARDAMAAANKAAGPETLLTPENTPGLAKLQADLGRWQRVPVRIISDPEGTTGDGRAAALTLTHNAVRTANPAADYAAIVVLLRRFADAGLSERAALTEVARATGLKTATVKQRLRLENLNGDLLQEFLEGRLAYTAALEVSRLGPGVQHALMAQVDLGAKPTLELVRQVRAEQVKAHQVRLFDALPPQQLRDLGAPVAPPSLAVRAGELEAQLRATRLPICIEAAQLIAELREAEEDHRTDAENRSLRDV